MMTKEEFMEYYARNCDMKVEQLKHLFLDAFPCDCGDKDCDGWEMLSTKKEQNIPSWAMHAVVLDGILYTDDGRTFDLSKLRR